MTAAGESVERAVSDAKAALEAWSARPLDERIALANAYAERLRALQKELTDLISRETFKPKWESATEVEAMIAKVALSIRAQQERRRPTETQSHGVTAATRYKPFGVVAVLGPFNFPGHLPNGHIVPALLAGNTVVFKPSELTPRVGQRIVELWREAGSPQGVISHVDGGSDVGRELVTHPDVAGVYFTGSFNAGRAINRALADHPGRIVALEMGGNNPLVVHDVADARAAAYLTIVSAYATAGQRCSCARRLIVPAGDNGDRFIETLAGMIPRIRVGMPDDDPPPYMGAVINARAAQRLLEAQAALVLLGAQTIVEMGSIGDPRDALLSPGLIDVSAVKHREDEEIFGPLLQLIRVRDFDEAMAEANNTRYGLCAGLLSDDRALWEQFCRRIRAGVVNWNRPLTGASSSLPFGGIGDSGNNRPSAYFAADYCSYPVASLEIDRVTMPATLAPGIEL